MTNPIATEKKIEDYLPYYLGCEVVLVGKKPGTKHYTLVGITLDGGYLFKTIPEGFSIDLGRDFKIALRPLSDMTKDELQECGNMVYDFSDEPELNNHRHTDFDICASEQFHYLLSKHFDLFGLIESGLALDKTKL